MSVTDRLLTPSKITAWLDCAHYLTLRHRLEDGTLGIPRRPFGSLAQLLVDKGLQHEADCLAGYQGRGLSVLEVPGRQTGESFTSWVTRIGDPLADGYDVVYQMPFIHDGVRGIADFLIRVEDPDTGAVGYEPLDAKLARSEAKPGHVLQLCFYADALEAATGRAPERIHLWLGSGRVESLRAAEFRPYWNRMRDQLEALLHADPATEATVPERCVHCEFCEFAEVCENEWRIADALVYVAGIRRSDMAALEPAGVTTLGGLAECGDPVEPVQPERLARLVAQASLQAQARTHPDRRPPYRLVDPTEDPTWGRGFDLMPAPDDGDVFLDFEGHPFWRADTGLFFLFGLIARDPAGGWVFEARWAHDRDEEAAVTRDLIGYFTARREAHPGMHVYHYNHTERSALQRLAADHGVGEAALDTLVETGLFVDLLTVARNAVQVGAESYGLKHLERLTTFERGHDIEKGAGAVVEYEAFTTDHDPGHLTRIGAYNEDDVRATLALRDWLVEQRPASLDWRAAVIDRDEDTADLDDQVAALHAFGPDTPQHLLGELLGYWLRERRANTAPKLAKTALDTPALLDDPDVIAGLTCRGAVARTGKNGRALTPAMGFDWPDQTISNAFDPDRPPSVLYSTPDGPTGYADICRIDRDSREVDLRWNERAEELATIPTVVVIDDWVHPRPKPAALSALAASVLDPASAGAPNEASMALLRRDLPAFTSGRGPRTGEFTDDLDDMTRWARHLDRTYVAVQGPPGTGKTYRGAHIVHSLITDGRRVGITAMSHHAIDNLLAAIVDVFAQHGDLAVLAAVRRHTKPRDGGLPGVTYASGNPQCANTEFNLVAGTTWLFANDALLDAPVDVLIIDEAGQLALADALAASRPARNIVLLGDPLQLAQVSQASHPGGGGRSVLEHALGDQTTISPERGVFLAETRRMHPDICQFISDHIYEGRLTSHPTCATQTTAAGTGLRWLRAHHTERSTESPEEAELVAAEIANLIGSPWTDQHGTQAPLGPEDFMVVAPYNDQVTLLRARLDLDPRTRHVPAGTVDKFQGREAPVVFFTMTTSTAGDMPRGPDFLFSRNRLNVAVSRARCLAYLVCTDELLNSRARTVEEMRLIATLCAFAETSSRSAPDAGNQRLTT